MIDHDEDFRRDAHPLGRFLRNALWLVVPVAFAAQDRIGVGVSIIIAVLTLIAVIVFRDKTPLQKAEGGLFWRITEGEHIRRAGAAPAEDARTGDIIGNIRMALGIAGVGVSAWLGPVGLGFTLGYIIFTAAKYRILLTFAAARG